MKTRLSFLSVALFCLTLFASCSSTQQLQSKQVSRFASVVNKTSLDVEYQPASTYEVIINGSDQDFALVKAEGKHGTLTIENKSVGNVVAVLKDAGDVNASCCDKGNITLSGRVRSLQHRNTGVGTVNAHDLKLTK